MIRCLRTQPHGLARFALPVTVLAIACAQGQRTTQDPTIISAQVDSATRAFQSAERARDVDRLIGHLAPDFAMLGDGIRSDYDAVVASIRQTMPTLDHFGTDWLNITVRPLGQDRAVVSFVFRDSLVTKTGDVMQFWGPTTLVWERIGEDWLIVFADADHYPIETMPLQ